MLYKYPVNHTVILLTIILFIGLPVFSISIEEISQVNNTIYSNQVKTVQIHRKGWEMAFPVIELNSSDKLQVSFDILDTKTENLQYKILHCTKDWKISNLSTFDYLAGFEENTIENYAYSYNTTYDYVHYDFEFPNENLKPIISGNYAIIVYKDYNTDSVLFTQRFYVLSRKVNVTGRTKRPTRVAITDIGQEVDFTIHHEGFPIKDPYSDISAVVLQNARSDFRLTNLKPLYIKPQELIYNYEEENVFLGLSEFRYFEFKSFRYQSENTQNIEFKNPYYHVYLFPDEVRKYGPYYFINELNGKYSIKVQEGRDDATDADYAYVHFTLLYDQDIPDADFFVVGDLTDWNYTEQNKMTFNPAKKAYELTLLLKQGYYNYMYALKDHDQSTVDISFVEGSFYETENDYTILVYHRGKVDRYDKLIGLKHLNTLRDEKQ